MAGAIPSGSDPTGWIAGTAGNVAKGYDPSAAAGVVVGTGATVSGQLTGIEAGLSNLVNRTQDALTAAYKEYVQNDPTLKAYSDLLFEGLNPNGSTPLSTLIIQAIGAALGIPQGELTSIEASLAAINSTFTALGGNVNQAMSNWDTLLTNLEQSTVTALATFLSAVSTNASGAAQDWATLLTTLEQADASAFAAYVSATQANAQSAFNNWDTLFTELGFSTDDAATFASWLSGVNSTASGANTLATAAYNNWNTIFTDLGLSSSTAAELATWLSGVSSTASTASTTASSAAATASSASTTATEAFNNWSTLFTDLGLSSADATTLASWLSGVSSTASSANTAAGTANTTATAAYNNWTTIFTDLGLSSYTATELASWLSGVNTTASGASAAASTANTTIGSHLTAIANSVGTTGATNLDAANSGIQAITNTLAAMSAQQSSANTAQTGAAVYGQSYQVAFAQYPDGAFNQAPFLTTVTGTGTGHLSISGGQSIWNEVSNGDVSVVGVYINNYVVTITATGGTFTLSWNGTPTSALAYNAPPATVQAALQAISGMPANNVVVGGTAGAYTIVFGIWGTFAANGASLTGTGAAAAVTFQGQTNTDYQELQASIGGFPNGTGSKNYALLRCNAAGTTYVYGLVYLNSSLQLCWELGCYVAGVHTVLASGTNAPPCLNFTFRAGVGGNPYRFQGVSGSQVVFDTIDTSHVSQVGSAYRYWGFRSDTANSGQSTPAPAAYVGCADNALPTTQGSGFRLSCSSTTQKSISVGTNASPPSSTPAYGLFPTGFWDTATNITPDITQTTWSGVDAVIIGTEGWYLFELRAQQLATAATGVVSIYAGYLRGTGGGTPVFESLANGPSVTVNVFGTTWCPTSLGGNCPIYCKAGDLIVPVVYVDTQPGTANALSSLAVFGEANHILTYWSMTSMFRQ